MRRAKNPKSWRVRFAKRRRLDFGCELTRVFKKYDLPEGILKRCGGAALRYTSDLRLKLKHWWLEF